MHKLTDTEILDALERYIKEHDYVFLHNLNGSTDPKWPQNYRGGGIGLLPYHPRTLREALIASCVKEARLRNA